SLPLLASAEERHTAHTSILLGWISARGCNVIEGDGNFVTANRNCRNCRQACLRPIANRYLVAQYLPVAPHLFYCVRLALRACLAEVWQSAARPLGCDERIQVVAGSRLLHDG